MMTMMFTTMMMITLFFCIGVVRMILIISTVVTAITAIAKCLYLMSCGLSLVRIMFHTSAAIQVQHLWAFSSL